MKNHFFNAKFGIFTTLIITLLMLFSMPHAVTAEAPPNEPPTKGSRSGWSTFIQGGYVHQFDTDIDNGGSFDVNRLFFQGGVSYGFDDLKSISLALGYGYDGYNFSGNSGLGGLNPWDDIHSFRVSAPLRWGLDKTWTIFAVPTLRFNKESGGDTGDSVNGGGFAGFSYRVSDRLTIGPGFGVITQIEDSASVFPVLIIDWKITDTLSLGTGRGLGATLGPGLILSWEPSRKWTLSLGGRYERLRFRLDDDGVAPKGVGDNRSFPLFGGVTYNISRKAQVSLLGGMELGGELKVEDEGGNTVIEEDYDSAGFIGLTFNLRF